MSVYSPGAAGKLQVLEGSNYLEIENATAITHSPTDAAVTSQETINSGVITTPGQAGPGTLSFDIVPNAALPFFDVLMKAATSGTEKVFRTEAGVPVVDAQGSSGNTIAIAANGDVTAAGTAKLNEAPFQVGKGIVISNVLYILTEVTSATAGKCVRYGAVASKVATKDSTALAAVAASTSWKLVSFATRKQFAGTPLSVPSITRSPTSRSSTVNVSLSGFPAITLLTEP